jgi:FkbM family methyltransferase
VSRAERLFFAAGASGPVALLRRAFRYIHRPCTYAGDGTLITQSVFGHFLYVDAQDTSLLPSLLLRGYWEPGVTRAMLRLVRPGQHVVEVGYYTVLFASGVTAAGTVTSFEANPRMVALLRRTLAANGFAAAVRVVPLAVTDRPGPVTLHRLDRQQGSSSLYPFSAVDLAAWDDRATPIEIEATSLDAFLGDGPPPDLVKIDAEGAEPAIVNGMPKLLERAPHVQLVVEFLPAVLERAGHDPRAFLGTLTRLGFRLQSIDRLTPETADRLLASRGADLYLSR